MSVDPMGWLDWTTKKPGPPEKVYNERNLMKGFALHSAEGFLTGTLGELMKPERQASWNFTVDGDGTVYQHYPVMASCWASGNRKANTELVAVECIGVAPNPVSSPQVQSLLRLVKDVGTYAGFKPSRAEPRTLHEHREVYNWISPNAGATACPSERYAPFYAALAGQVEPTKASDPLEDLLLSLFAGSEQVGERPNRDARLNYARYRVAEIAAGKAPSLGELAARINEHQHGGVRRD